MIHWYEWVTWGVNIALLVVGAGGIWVAVSTLKKIERQTAATEKQTVINSRTLIAQFRPRIVVRQMRLDPSAVIFYERRNDGKWKIIMQLANVGGTDATITEGTGYFQEYWGNRPHRDLAPRWTLDKPILIPPGARSEIEYSLPTEEFRVFMRTLEFSTAAKNKQPPRGPVFHGSIRYVDEMGTSRETGFGRRWDVMDQCFEPLPDPNFEYED
jgi:hypothetical protein